MPPVDPRPLPRAVFRSSPEDFIVDEIPAYSPSGKGEHLFITIKKTGWTTLDAMRRLATALEVDPRGAGFAGMKDKHAVTSQTLSFPLPIAKSPEETVARAQGISGIEILGFSRHENKLKPGHLVGNRFRITLRGLDAEGLDEVRARLEAIKTTGVPNAFGPQRFGRDGENPERALAFVRGEIRGPRDRREQRLLFSSLQSLLFNRVLEKREASGTWNTVLPGDLAKKHDTGGLFLVAAEGPERTDAEERAIAGGISPTGPMFGAKMRWPEGAPMELEKSVLDASLGNPERLEGLRHLGEGTRRALRMMVSDLTIETFEEGQSGHSLAVCFVLPKGGYATTVLARACDLIETRGAAREDSPAADAAAPGDDDVANDD